MDDDKVFSLIGIATKAGYTVSGEYAVLKSIRERRAKLVIVSSEASENSLDMYRNKSDYYDVKCVVFGTKEQLGKATGQKHRTSVAVIDKGLSESILSRVEDWR